MLLADPPFLSLASGPADNRNSNLHTGKSHRNRDHCSRLYSPRNRNSRNRNLQKDNKSQFSQLDYPIGYAWRVFFFFNYYKLACREKSQVTILAKFYSAVFTTYTNIYFYFIYNKFYSIHKCGNTFTS